MCVSVCMYVGNENESIDVQHRPCFKCMEYDSIVIQPSNMLKKNRFIGLVFEYCIGGAGDESRSEVVCACSENGFCRGGGWRTTFYCAILLRTHTWLLA